MSRPSPARACRSTRARAPSGGRDDQQETGPAGAGNRGGLGHRAGEDRTTWCRRRRIQGPGAAVADRAASWLVVVALVAGTLTFVGWLIAVPMSARAVVCDLGGGDHLPGCAWAGDPDAIMVGSALGAKRGSCSRTPPRGRRRRTWTRWCSTRPAPSPAARPRSSRSPRRGHNGGGTAAAGRRRRARLRAPARQAIERRQRAGLEPPPPAVQAVPGEGALATVEGKRVAAGTRGSSNANNISPAGSQRATQLAARAAPQCQSGSTGTRQA